MPRRPRRHAQLLIVAPFPAVAASVLAVGPAVTFWRGLGALTLSLDVPRAILLGVCVCALLWVAAAVHAAAERHGSPVTYQFAVCWLLTLAGNVGVFVTADLASFFLSFTLVSIPAYGLITNDDTSETSHAGAVDMAYVPPWRGATLALLIAGFGMNIGLVSLHVWMPLTYRAAPIHASGVPLTGGALAKLALKALLGSGLASILNSLSAAGTTLLMLHFMRLVAGLATQEPGPAPIRLTGLYLVWQAARL